MSGSFHSAAYVALDTPHLIDVATIIAMGMFCLGFVIGAGVATYLYGRNHDVDL